MRTAIRLLMTLSVPSAAWAGQREYEALTYNDVTDGHPPPCQPGVRHHLRRA